MVALYYKNNGTGSVLSQTASGKKLKGVSATAADGALAIPEDAAELTVSVDENGYYTFTCGGNVRRNGQLRDVCGRGGRLQSLEAAEGK